MDISYYENEIEKYNKEKEHLEKELSSLYEAKSIIPLNEFLKEEATIKKYMESNELKIAENNKIINAYKSMIENITSLRSLNESKPDYNHPEVKEELNRKRNEIEESKKILPQELIDDIYKTIELENQNKAQSIDNPELDLSTKKKTGIEYYEDQIKSELENIKYLETRLPNMELIKKYNPSLVYKYSMEEDKINKQLTEEKAKLKQNEEIVNTYNETLENVNALKRLANSNPDYSRNDVKDEIVKRSKVIDENKKNLPDDLVDEIDDKFIQDMKNKVAQANKVDEPKVDDTIKQNDDDKKLDDEDSSKVKPFGGGSDSGSSSSSSTSDSGNQSNNNSEALANVKPQGLSVIPPQNLDVKNTTKQKEEEPTKVVGNKAWNWIKKNKKKILIALGITAITVAVIILISQLMPAIAALSEAQQISALTTSMLNNAASWHGASTAGRTALHLANEGLANSVMSLTGKAALFNSSTGVWTFAGTELGSFAVSASSAVTAQIAKVAAISKTAAILGAGGLGVTGLGALLNDKKGSKKTKKVVENSPEPNSIPNKPEDSQEFANPNNPTRNDDDSQVYNKYNTRIDGIITHFKLLTDDIKMKDALLKRLQSIYNEIENSTKLGLEERELLKEKINSFVDSLDNNMERK